MSAAHRFDPEPAQELARERLGPGRLVVRPCGCGQCGRTFELVTAGRGQRRVYAEGCPVHAAEVRERNRASSARCIGRLRDTSPRRCHCGCGRVLPPRVWYHPDCAPTAKATKARDGARKGTPRQGKRCGLCEGQPWRRHPELGCIRCGAPYAPERIWRPEANAGSGLGQL